MVPILRKMACSVFERLTQQNLLAMVGPTSGTYKLLSTLPLSSWSIISFDSINAVVCIQINASSGSRVITVTLDVNALETLENIPRSLPSTSGVHPTTAPYTQVPPSGFTIGFSCGEAFALAVGTSV